MAIIYGYRVIKNKFKIFNIIFLIIMADCNPATYLPLADKRLDQAGAFQSLVQVQKEGVHSFEGDHSVQMVLHPHLTNRGGIIIHTYTRMSIKQVPLRYVICMPCTQVVTEICNLQYALYMPCTQVVTEICNMQYASCPVLKQLKLKL